MPGEATPPVPSDEQITRDLALMVGRLAYRLHKLHPGDEVAEQAVAYLIRIGRPGSVFRSEGC